MGSSSSVSKPQKQYQPNTRREQASAPSSRRQKGFKEVQFNHTPEANPSTQSQHGDRASPSNSMADPGGRNPRGSHRKSSTSSTGVTYQSRDAQVPSTSGNQDFHGVVHQMHREKTMMAEEFELPKYSADQDLVLETFYHKNGEVYSCLYQSGERFLIDSQGDKDLTKFPQKWYKEGLLVTDRAITDKNDFINDQSSDPSQIDIQDPFPTPGRMPHVADDREGFIDHPKKGRLSTYIQEEKRNVHYYFDQDCGTWVKLPISWELHSELVQKLMEPIEEALPDWSDKHDILAVLRSCNYDPHDTISNYLTYADTGGLSAPRNASDAKVLQQKEDRIKDLEKKVEKLSTKLGRTQRQLEMEIEDSKAADIQMQELKEEVSTLEVRASTAMAQVEAYQRERPKTAAGRPPSARRIKSPEPEPEPQPTVEPETVLALEASAKTLHKEYLKLKMDTGKKFQEIQGMISHVAVGFKKVQKMDSSQSNELEEIKQLYRREALQRKLLYNKVQELRGNIRVFCRCRRDSQATYCVQYPSDREVLMPNGRKPFKFDKVFKPDSTQEEIFEDTMPIITSCVDGYNVCIMAYGQTGSGKTYTMQGPPESPGVNVRSIQELLKICQERENIDYNLKAAMVEIYNEAVQDLLNSDAAVLELRAQGNKVVMPGLKEMEVKTRKDIDLILKLGVKNRKTAATKMNSQSSRSHLIFMITVIGHDRASGAVSTGTLTLCDLAGSERVSKTEAQGHRLVEAAAINKSLSALGQVFTSLRTGQLHVPYRNAKLTHLLQPSLGGDAKACLFVTISPDMDNLQESTSTLEFGSNARQVALGQAKQNISRKAPTT